MTLATFTTVNLAPVIGVKGSVALGTHESPFLYSGLEMSSHTPSLSSARSVRLGNRAGEALSTLYKSAAPNKFS